MLSLVHCIDDFVEHIVIKKTVEPSLDFISNGMQKKVKVSTKN